MPIVNGLISTMLLALLRRHALSYVHRDAERGESGDGSISVALDVVVFVTK
jgi:hypothetical protein